LNRALVPLDKEAKANLRTWISVWQGQYKTASPWEFHYWMNLDIQDKEGHTVVRWNKGS
jgi:hypothetical protein